MMFPIGTQIVRVDGDARVGYIRFIVEHPDLPESAEGSEPVAICEVIRRSERRAFTLPDGKRVEDKHERRFFCDS